MAVPEEIEMRKITIVSRKYDGRLRDEYEAFLYAEDAEQLVVFSPAGMPSYDHRKQAWVAAPTVCWSCISKRAGIQSGMSASRPAISTT